MAPHDAPRILCVDDERNILHALMRGLRSNYEVKTAISGPDGLRIIQEEGPFAVVVSDMKMPGMNGAEFLRQVRETSPDSVRILLTAFAELEIVVAAVNEGFIFRFLTKPCPSKVLIDAIEQAVEQHRLITAERVLLEQTLRGSIAALTEVLSLSNPTAFGRATRFRHHARLCAIEMKIKDRWLVEIGAMLSQLACITLPADTLDKVYYGKLLEAHEEAAVSRLPEINEQILTNIPRLEELRAILRYQNKYFDGQGPPDDEVAGEDIPLGARILKAVVDFDTLEQQGSTPEKAMATLRDRSGWYDPAVLDAFTKVVRSGRAKLSAEALPLRKMEKGMILVEDVMSKAGALLVARGQEVTVGLIGRIQNFADTIGVKEPLWVHIPEELAPAKEAASPTQTEAPDRAVPLDEVGNEDFADTPRETVKSLDK